MSPATISVGSKFPVGSRTDTGKALQFDVAAGFDTPPHPVDSYKLVIQCGGCMLTRKQLINRLRPFVERGIPVTNYGMAITASADLLRTDVRIGGRVGKDRRLAVVRNNDR